MTTAPEVEQSAAEAQYCAETFNGAIASAALSAAWEIGLLDELAVKHQVDIAEFARDRDAHPETVRALLVALSTRRIVSLDPLRSTAFTDTGFEPAFSTKGFFYWLTRGCGELLTTLPTKVVNEDRQGEYARRDARAISVACRNIARSFFDPPFRDLIRDVDSNTVADLGCGSGDRIVMLAGMRPEISAIGIDVAEGAIAVSKEAVAEAGLADRITLVRDDVLDLAPRPEYQDVDLVTCFLMGHDFWPQENAVRTLRSLRETFPNIKNLVLGDTCRSTGVNGPEHPMFTLGFETVHAVMGQYLPSLDEWTSTIEEGGWRIADRRMIDLPAFSFIYRLTPA
ncbi:class I SAM-dependent methyltransferase [Streptomyces griseofuscus]|uniref:class I SAM-dependent methyltransferase n=1 Tax=Streptomyces TaxID=1883 RepID=UPI0018F0F37E|nr:class I SAM-dependent methyltransferase [Streptomyces sp. CRPSP2-6A1]MBJ7002383.1 methyltransferase domain-containing protein [Streptomyces sp. CRPSP2-6A1]